MGLIMILGTHVTIANKIAKEMQEKAIPLIEGIDYPLFKSMKYLDQIAYVKDVLYVLLGFLERRFVEEHIPLFKNDLLQIAGITGNPYFQLVTETDTFIDFYKRFYDESTSYYAYKPVQEDGVWKLEKSSKKFWLATARGNILLAVSKGLVKQGKERFTKDFSHHQSMIEKVSSTDSTFNLHRHFKNHIVGTLNRFRRNFMNYVAEQGNYLFRWNLSNAPNRKRDICDDFAEEKTDYGVGVYDISSLPPYPHENCLCYIEVISA